MSYFNSYTNMSIEDYVQYLNQNTPQRITHNGVTNTVTTIMNSVASDSDKATAFENAVSGFGVVTKNDSKYSIPSPNRALWDSDNSDLVIVDYTTVTASVSV